MFSNLRRLAFPLHCSDDGSPGGYTGGGNSYRHAKFRPESLTIAPGDVLFAGSAATPFVNSVRRSSRREISIEASAQSPGIFFFGMLTDASTDMLWTCQLTPVAGLHPRSGTPL